MEDRLGSKNSWRMNGTAGLKRIFEQVASRKRYGGRTQTLNRGSVIRYNPLPGKQWGRESMMERLILYCAFLTSLIGAIGCGVAPLDGLDAPEQLTLYSIDGRDFEQGEKPQTAEMFHDFPVLGKIEIKDAEKGQDILSALKNGLAQKDVNMAKCFWPRHAIRTRKKGRTFDYVICFECYQVELYVGNSKKTVTIGRDAQQVLNKHLKEANIALAPGIAGLDK